MYSSLFLSHVRYRVCNPFSFYLCTRQTTRGGWLWQQTAYNDAWSARKCSPAEITWNDRSEYLLWVFLSFSLCIAGCEKKIIVTMHRKSEREIEVEVERFEGTTIHTKAVVVSPLFLWIELCVSSVNDLFTRPASHRRALFRTIIANISSGDPRHRTQIVSVVHHRSRRPVNTSDLAFQSY